MSKFLKITSLLIAFALFLVSTLSCNNKLMRKVTILYYTDGENLKSLTMEIQDGAFLKGDPSKWSGGKWKLSGTTGDYGYSVQTENNDEKKYFFRKDANENWNFIDTASERVFSTNLPITSDLSLLPKYTESQSSVNINLVYYISNVTYNQNGVPSYSLKECKYSENFQPNADGTYSFNVTNFINKIRSEAVNESERQVMDAEVGYGYVDYSAEGKGKRYYLDPEDYTLVDSEGVEYSENATAKSDTDLHFRYVDAGYAPIENYLGIANSVPLYLNMIYVPGTDKAYPWPNSQANSANYAIVNDLTRNGNIVSDLKDYNHPINDLMVAEIPLTRKLVNMLTKAPFDDIFNTKFKFYTTGQGIETPKAFDSEYGLSNSNLNLGWNYVSIDVAMLMANMMTYVYNMANRKVNSEFDELSYVYMVSNNQPLMDITSPDFNVSNVIINHEANGFRLMSSPEWEYCAKVVTDERQVPDFTSAAVAILGNVYHKKGEGTGYRFYFQNSNEGEYGIQYEATHGGVYYSGSGAALAEASEDANINCVKVNSVSVKHLYGDNTTNVPFIKYDKTSPRKGYMVLCRNTQTDARDSSSFVLASVPADIGSYSAYNTRNGAGLYNMSGALVNLTDSIFNISSDRAAVIFANRGSSFKHTSYTSTNKSPLRHSIAYCVEPSTINYGAWDDISIRLCRNATN